MGGRMERTDVSGNPTRIRIKTGGSLGGQERSTVRIAVMAYPYAFNFYIKITSCWKLRVGEGSHVGQRVGSPIYIGPAGRV